MAFRKKWPAILELNPDVLIIQECEMESKYKHSEKMPDVNQFLWFGENENKGVGVFTFNGYEIALTSPYSKKYKYIIPLELKGRSKINLFAIWAMPHEKKMESYVGQIWNAMQYYKSKLNQPTILIGDLNSNAQWDHERKIGNHSQLTEFLKAYSINSIYHSLRNEDHGLEKEPTLYLLKQIQKPYHLDYCFASNSLITKKTTIEIGKADDWLKLSDHMPVIIENLLP